MVLDKFRGKKVALLGFGIENISVAKFLYKNGINFTVLDRAPVGKMTEEAQKLVASCQLPVASGEKYLENLDQFNVIVRSPGVPYLTAEIQAAKSSGSEITSSTKLFFDLCPAEIIGVTGTKGKGTTASIIKEIIERNFQFSIFNFQKNTPSAKVYLVGNIGVPSFDIIEEVKIDDFVVFELSSFQLQDMEMSPHIAVVVNLADDHLDYHQTIEEYRATKQNILKYQNKNDFAIINWDYPESRKLDKFGAAKKYYFSSKEKVVGAYVNQGGDVFLTNGREEKVCNQRELKLIGRHNLENIASAAIVGHVLGIKTGEISKAVKDFDGLPHRLEFIRQVDGVKFYNDSFSTNPTPTIAAIKSFSTPITIILGGSEKGADFSQLAEVIKSSSVKNIIVIGIEGPRIRQAIIDTKAKVNIINGGKSIDEIVNIAMKNTQNGGVVLFSPACASFDMFKNYKDRGEKFINAVNQL
ncbi:MAG: UDP-N-acetylmuramoyl-L-alanine--D-glutamate ligase [Candidatus Berkelbacteria bacterium]|nr:UDP-N-acetylmuramoyl-L-alanine--D-glutamate ligase [Candidatus Berkelbacteria bacterium]